MRYLTKSRFKLAVECPTKLFYTGKGAVYVDCKLDDEFLMSLAEGGFQVGELAKVMHPGGIEVQAKTHAEQLEETAKLLQGDEVTIFEAAICHENLFARVDILRKSANKLELIEVKAKSFDSDQHGGFRRARGGIDRNMLPYLQDVAFQKYVLRQSYPGMQVQSFLMLADKSKQASVDGLNQRFKIRRVNGRPVVTVAVGTDSQSIGDPVLERVNVDALVDEILTQPVEFPGGAAPLHELANRWARHYADDTRIAPTLGRQCDRCEFRVDAPTEGQRSGFHECWTEVTGCDKPELDQGTVLDLWNFRRKQQLIDRGIYLLRKVPPDEFDSDSSAQGLTAANRQAMQVSGRWPGKRKDFFLDEALVCCEMASWSYPLHFIDFETARVAIPFFKGHRPFANVAFQFSHHVVESDGSVAHRHEFLDATPGRIPNYEFARQLRNALGDQGTIFMWSPHENTTLNAILQELEDDSSPPDDCDVLMDFIRGLTTRKVDAKVKQTGSRAMVDLCLLAKRAFFHPSTKGGSSIKKVLPAVMAASDFLRERYAKPIYGAADGIPSLNFKDQVWWREEEGVVADPYKLLPPVFENLPSEVIDFLESDEELEIAQGGAATMAYARLQFEDLALDERQRIESALKRYCELDTLAMVMVFEAWREWSR